MTTAGATDIEQAGATLSASFQGALAAPRELGFYWGTSASAVTNELYVSSGSSTSGSFSKALTSLAANTTYYYKAYILTSDGQYVYGDVKSFKTQAASPVTGDQTAYAQSWLGGYEVPATTVSLSTSNTKYSGKYVHSTVAEAYGTTQACIYNTASSSQRVVTHTFGYDGKVLPTYTMLFDQSRKCALWCAFEAGAADYPDNGVGRNEAWSADPAIDASWQFGGSYGSNYTKGHQVASNDRQTSKEQNKQTFYYSNMTPQSSTLNNGTWATLEGAVQGLATRTTGTTRLFVVTGPLFEGTISTITCANGTCPVPSGYFKCIMQCTFDSNGNMTGAKGAGYVFNHTGDLSRQNVTIDSIEARTGFDFFANVPDTLENAAEASSYNFF